MSLFSSIQLANNALIASQVGIQVTGNNIANANTPGYIREEVVFTPAPTQRKGDLLLGLGVDVQGIVQKVDLFLEERLRGARSDLANGETQENTYLQLEAIVGELSDTDLSTSLDSFFNSINDILNQPESIPVRNLAVLQGKTLADDIQRLDRRVREIRVDANNRVVNAADDINRLLEEISKLNLQIVNVEGGGVTFSDAVGLRDKRQLRLSELSEIVDIQSVEQTNGSVSVFSNGDYLVFEGGFREVKVEYESDRGLNIAEIRLAATDRKLDSSSGELAGLIASRDDILGGFLDSLDKFTQTLSFEFNRIFTSGQGLSGYGSIDSEFQVADAAAALDQAGLTYTPENGSFQVQVHNKQTGLTQTTDVLVKLNGLSSDTTLDGLAAQLNAIDGLTATVTAQRGLSIAGDSSNIEFAFADDTSGVLAALGVNTFFTGTGASDIGVRQAIRTDPGKFATSRGGVGADTEIAVELAQLFEKPLDSQGGDSLADIYTRMTADTIQGSAVATAVAEGFRVFQRTLEGQQLGISGVSIDEEAVNMITYQRAFQASARFIATVSEMLDILVSL
ncbi:MAG: flagellar hook-associated protein FlgK [Pirellulaceae bacterium]